MSARPAHVAFVDDDLASTRSLIRSLERRGADFDCFGTGDAAEALDYVRDKQAEAAVIDLALEPVLGPEAGYRLITELLVRDPTIRILVLTGHGSEEYGVRALLHGAASFLIKPADPSHLLTLLNDAISYAKLKRSYLRLLNASKAGAHVCSIRSRAAAMAPVLDAVSFAGATTQPVLITGETGTGKGVIARAIHNADPKRQGPFIRVQPSFANHDLVSSEIFGHTKGAFTGATENRKGLIEEAHRGTLFIDEVDELPNETQVLLLNVLQERVYRRLGSNVEHKSDFRLIAATNRNPVGLLERGKLRNDFYHRIAHLTVEIPPLRERPEDVVDLADEFLRTTVERDKLPIQGISTGAQAKLLSYDWPGNVRELQAAIESAAFFARYNHRRYIEAPDLRFKAKLTPHQPLDPSFRERIRLYEEKLVQEALAKHNNNQSRAAAALQLDRTSFRRILARTGS